ncbi:MAG: DUF512 domain-containing protein [Chloroflexi bacterium]|nr:DUF512 domain-containing protein [Chloroflexota bacterium]
MTSSVSETPAGGLITKVHPRSAARRAGLHSGDRLLSVNGHSVEDVIDVQYYAAEYDLSFVINRNGRQLRKRTRRREGEPLGIDFEHPTFDIDIRRCNNLCEFCFVLQMAPRFRRTLYIKDDDYRYSFLFGHYVTLTNLSDHDTQRIMDQHLSPLYVSVHATDDELRRDYLRNATAPDILPQLRMFIDHGIEFHTQIVVTPGHNDGDYLERSVRDLAELYPSVRSVSIVPVGLTKHHKYQMRPHTVAEANQILDTCQAWQDEFHDELGVNFVYPTDEWYLVTRRPVPPVEEIDGLDLHENGLGMVRHFMDEWQASQQELGQQPQVKHLTLVTATLFGPTLEQHAIEFAQKSGVRTDVVQVLNDRLGHSITVAGLLMADDVIAQLQKGDKALGDVVVLPRIMFDHPQGLSLDDKSPLDVARALNRPIALVDLMGDLVDIVDGRPALYVDPQQDELLSPDAIKSEGGWAVEKLL